MPKTVVKNVIRTVIILGSALLLLDESYAAKPAVVGSETKLQAAIKDPGQLVLKAATFDPTSGALPSFAGRIPDGQLARPSSQTALVLVQFRSGPSEQEQTAIAKTGGVVLSYIPNHALLVRVKSGVDPTALRTVQGVRWVGPYEPGYRIDPSFARELMAQAASNFTSGKLAELAVQLASPVDAAALAESVKASFGEASIRAPRTGSSVMRIAVAEGSGPGLVGALLRDPAVLWIERDVPASPFNDNSVWIGQSYDRTHGPSEALASDPKPYSLSATAWNHGLLGEGQIVGIGDTSLDIGMCYFFDPLHDVLDQYVEPPGAIQTDPAHRKILARNFATGSPDGGADTFRHGTHVAGSVAGDNFAHPAGSTAGHDTGDGMAPKAKLIFEVIDPGGPHNCDGTAYVPLGPMLLQEYNAGARISNYSWGSLGNVYNSDSAEIDGISWSHEDFSLFFAAGNHGAGGVSKESAAKDGIGVGASETYDATFNDEFGILDPENMTSTSAQGFLSDGRYKPDFAAPGYNIVSSRFPVARYTDASDPHCDASNPNVCFPGTGCYVTDTSSTCTAFPLSGTSMASPTAAGLAALARQYFTDGFYPGGQANPSSVHTPSAALLKAVLINGARNMTGHTYDRRGDGVPHVDYGPLADAPGPKQGWGRIMLDDALYFPGDTRRLRIFDVPNASGVRTGVASTFQFNVSSSSEPLKVTLAWTDPPGATSGGVALVNNLDLEITAPDGTIFHGNKWTPDNINLSGDVVSAPNPAGWDIVNNVEGVLVPSPAQGLYKARVIGSNVPGYQSRFTQGYAVAVTGATSDCTTAAAPIATADPIRFDHVRVTWTAVPGALEYKIFRNSDGCATPMSPSVIFSAAAGQTSYDDFSTVPASNYYYAVRAVMSAAGCAADSNCAPAPTLPPPTVTGITPTNGVNNETTMVTVTGAGFVSTPQLYLGTASQPQKYALAGVAFDSSTQLHATVPVNLQNGSYTLTVVNPDTQSGSKANVFTVVAPFQTVSAFTADYDIVGQPNYTVSVVDVQGTASTTTIPLGPFTGPSDVAIGSDQTLGVITYWWPPERVALLQPVTRSVLQTVNLPSGRRGEGVVIDSTGGYAYVLNRGYGTPAQAYLSKLDLATKAFVTHVAIGQGILNWPTDDVAISADGTKVCATNSYSGTVSVLTTSDMQVHTVTVGTTPVGLAVSADSSKLYVANQDSNSVSVVNLSSYTVTSTFSVSGVGSPRSLTLTNSDTLLQVGGDAGIATLNPTTGATIRTGASGVQFQRLSWLASTGKVYGLNSGNNPSRVYRVNPSTLALEAYGSAGGGSTGMEVLDPKAPTIVSVVPNTGCKNGGAIVTITGTQFQGEVRDDANQIVQQRTRVYFGTTELTSVTFVNSTRIDVVARAHASGFVNVVVTNPSGKSATLVNGFRYLTFSCDQ